MSTVAQHLPQLYVLFLALSLCAHAIHAQAPTESPTPSPSPAPAPAPAFCNITQVIQSAGQFTNFLQLLSDTQAGERFQNQANQSNVGITVFAPTDEAFAAQPAATLLKNITEQQKVSLCHFHALTKWYSLSSLQQVNNMMLSTFATYNANINGGKYTVNVSDFNGTVTVRTEWTTAAISSTLYNAEPCSVFAINEVLLPIDIFGMPSPAAPTPAPSGSTSTDGSSGATPTATPPSASQPSHSAPLVHYTFQLAMTSIFLLIFTSMLS
ncbi:hypothetical protein GOP47_0003356 [Adiantum capillus-veneris]|uniref:FAS1 domain-containing protein n=1 Tax=Adiantum capillus-veneris TaxID=13818 RepID=A0A9D4VDM1_ADICA|nr:hypothetical protein GOP47_0003356 [Adiantum capillus-veneris]